MNEKIEVACVAFAVVLYLIILIEPKYEREFYHSKFHTKHFSSKER